VYSGGTRLDGGTLNINAAAAVGTGTITVNGGSLGNTSGATVTMRAGNAQVWAGDLAFVGPSDLNMGTGDVVLVGGERSATVSAGTLTVGRITGTAGGFTKAGNGMLVVAPVGGASAVTGALTVSAGTLAIGEQDFAAGGLAGSGTIANGSNTTRWLIVTNTTADTFAGVMANGGGSGLLGLSKQGTGSLTLTAANTYGDVTTVGGGTLAFSGGGSALNSSRYVISSGDGVLQVGGNGRIGSSPIEIQSLGANPSTATNRLEVSGGASLANPITLAPKNNGNATILSTSGSNALTGGITIVTGGSSSRIESAAGVLTIGGTISTTAGSLRTLVLGGAGNGRVTGAVVDNAANVAGTISVVKEGTGSWTLAGQSLNTGATTINAGTLLANTDVTASAITVNIGGALGGSGTAGSLTMTAGATLSPGDGVGTLTAAQSLSLPGGGRYNWQVANATGTAGAASGWDLLTVAGTLDVAATSADPFSIDLWTLSSTSPVTSGLAANFSAASDYTWTIATAAGGISNFSADAFTVITSPTNGTGGFANAFGTGTFRVAQSGNDLQLVFTHGVAPVVITIDVASGTQTQTQAGYPLLSGTIPVVKTGAGTLVVDQANTLTASTTVQGGVLRLANGSALSSSTLAVIAGGTAQVGSRVVTAVAGLDLSANGLVDVTSGFMTVASGLSAVELVNEIVAGRAGGLWTGTSGITSSTAAADVALGTSRAVGWLDNGNGSLSFAFAAPGDTNLDWQVNVLDAANLLTAGKFNTGAPATWIQGDFNYDGVVDVLDAADFIATGLYNQGVYNAASGAVGAVAAVPEPTAVGMAVIGMSLGAIAARRRFGAAHSRLRRRRSIRQAD
ncbi:MAG: beta strand repeat-containing protein, partial [Pirellulales bacterium]